MPTLLDKAIGYISPKWALQRRAWQDYAASYKGGVPNRGSESWAKTENHLFSTMADRQQLASARDRAYNAYRNNLVARTLINTETDNVIGDMLNYQPQTDSKEWNTEAEDKYYEWMDEASVRGPDIHTGCELQRMIWDRSRVGGDAGWILVGLENNGRIESRVQVVQGEAIVTPDRLLSDNSVFDGIRYNSLGKPSAFYIQSIDERGMRSWAEVSARDFVYMPHTTDANQARGETCFNQVFDLLSQIDRYVDGVALAAWMATVFGIVFKQENSAKQLNLLESAYNSAGQIQKAITLEGPLVKFVGAKDEVAQVQAHQPMQQTPDFIRAMLRLAGMVFGMPLEAFARDLSTCNFASARIGLLPFYKLCKIRGQGTFAPRWSRTIKWWLSRENNRKDDDPKKWKTKFPENYWKHELLSNAWEYTDPVSEAQADHLQIDMGTKSPQMVIKERGGNEEKILADRLEWQKATKELPLLHSTMTRDPAPEPVEPTEPEDKKELAKDVVKAYSRALIDLMHMQKEVQTDPDSD